MNQKMAIALIILGALIIITGLTLALTSIKPMYFNVFAGLIILIGTFFGLFGKQLQDQSSSEKSDKILKTGEITSEKIDALNGQNENLKIKIDSQAITIDNLRKENTDLYLKLAETSKEIYKEITGGDSYCFLKVWFFGATAGNPTFNLVNFGKTTLKDVQISIQDLGRRVYLINSQANGDYTSPLVNQIVDNTNYNLEYTTIKPNTAVRDIPIPVEEGQKDINLVIWIHLSNGTLVETLEIKNFRSENRTEKMELKKGKKILEAK